MFGQEPDCTPEVINNAFIEAVEYINPVIANKSKQYNSLFLNMIPRGTFTYGEGYVKKSETFYGGTAVQDCGASWEVMAPYRAPGTNSADDAGNDPCRYDAPVVGYGIEEKQYTIRQATRRTLDVCLTDILFRWQFKKQLALQFGMLSNITLGEWEQVLRETYIDFCTILTVVNDATTDYRLAETTYGFGDTEIAIPTGGLDTIGTLTQAILDRVYEYLFRQARMGAIATDDGMPVFGLITSPETSTNLIQSDPNRADFHYANPQILVEGIGKVKKYKYFAHIHDAHVPRFKVNATGTALERVHPFTTSPTTIGELVKIDPEYVNAPYELSIVKMKNVYKALVPPSNPTNISNHTFGKADNLGQFHWINIQDRTENMLNEKGFFFARFRMAPEPGEQSTDCVAFLHRRCIAQTIVSCIATGASATAETISAMAQYDDSEDLDDSTLYIVTLADDINVQSGQRATFKTQTGTDDHPVTIVDDSQAASGIYVIAFEAGVSGGFILHDGGYKSLTAGYSA
jgi:hypothetical protein